MSHIISLPESHNRGPGAAPVRAAAWIVLVIVAALSYVAAQRLTASLPGVAAAVAMGAVTFAALAVVFTSFERLMPEKRLAHAWTSHERMVDVAYWLGAYAARFAADVATTAGILVMVQLLPWRPSGLVSGQPIALQVVEALLVGDLLQYWIHRALHRPALWALHAIHHSPEDLTWLATTRIHPMETIIKGPVEMIPLYLLGFSTVATLPLVVILLGLYEIFLHANVGWRFGALRFAIASPAFHRWHHTAETAGFNKNYAGIFPFYDIAFGTFYMPDRSSSAYGLGAGQHMVPSYWRQLVHPIHSAITTDVRAADRVRTEAA